MKKRRWQLLMAVLICMLGIAGCSGAAESVAENGTISVDTMIDDVREMLEAADSFTSDFKVTVAMGDAGETVTEGTVAFVKEPLYMKVDTVMALGDQEQAYAMYLEKTDDTVNQYMKYNGEWTEMTLTEDSAMASVQIYHTLYNMETIFSAAENWSVEEKDDFLVLAGAIPSEKFYDVENYTRWFQMAGMSGLSEVYFDGVEDVLVEITLDKKTGKPVSYAVDLTKALETVTNNVLAELSGDISGNGIEVTAYRIVSELTQLGDVEAEEIPAEAKSDAINYEKEFSMMESIE